MHSCCFPKIIYSKYEAVKAVTAVIVALEFLFFEESPQCLMQITNPRVTSQRYRKLHHELDILQTDHE